MGNRVAAHRAAEDQQDSRQDSGLDHRKGDPAHDLPLRRIQDRSRFFQVGVHILENAADQDVSERGIVEAQNHRAGEDALAPPVREADPEKRSKKAVGSSRYLIAVEHMLPNDSQCPLGHDVRENKNGA